jgi:DNA-binding CsgD family transcriptional regulator
MSPALLCNDDLAMLTFEHDGFSFCYLDQKPSPGQPRDAPFVFQHGIGGTHCQPSVLMAPLPPAVRLIALDGRGHGETRPTSRLVQPRYMTNHFNFVAHLAIGAARPHAFAESEAILTPTGRSKHAEGPVEGAHKALAQGVVAMDLARGKLRADDPDAALDAWRGLIAGRWSLVEHIDTDGKRFLVARKNDPDAFGPAAVSQRERQIMAARARGLSLKIIAYDLGLSIASVSRGLQSGMAKLGMSHEAELVALFSMSMHPSSP